MKLRRLSPLGIEQFSKFLDSMTTPEPEAIPSSLLNSPAASKPVEVDSDVDLIPFGTRFDLARYLDTKLTESGLKNLNRDVELWAWLALFFFDQLCPADDDGRRHPGERARWIPAVNDYRKYYRHLIAGPYWIYRAHRDDPSRVRAVLAGPVDQPGDIAEQLASRQEIVTNKAAMALATRLYIAEETGRPKKGAAGRGPGSARRLADILNQFDLTWDLYSMEVAAMLKMMPKEFNRFM